MKYCSLLFIFCHLCFSGEYVFYVRDLRGDPIPNLAVEALGGNQTLADATGKLIMAINKEPGSWLELVINDAQYRWIAPYDGRLTVTSPADTNTLIVAKKREKDIITSQAGVEALLKMTIDELQPKKQGQEMHVQTALLRVPPVKVLS